MKWKYYLDFNVLKRDKFGYTGLQQWQVTLIYIGLVKLAQDQIQIGQS